MNKERILNEIKGLLESYDIIIWALEQEKYKNIIVDYKEDKKWVKKITKKENKKD